MPKFVSPLPVSGEEARARLQKRADDLDKIVDDFGHLFPPEKKQGLRQSAADLREEAAKIPGE